MSPQVRDARSGERSLIENPHREAAEKYWQRMINVIKLRKSLSF